MPKSLARYLAVVLSPQNLQPFRTPYFLFAEWMALKMAIGCFCLGAVHLVFVIATDLGLAQLDPASYSYHASSTTLDAVVLACVLGILYKLYNRKITQQQFAWCSDVHTHMGMPAPTMEMRRLELALYAYRFNELDEGIQERFHPLEYE